MTKPILKFILLIVFAAIQNGCNSSDHTNESNSDLDSNFQARICEYLAAMNEECIINNEPKDFQIFARFFFAYVDSSLYLRIDKGEKYYKVITKTLPAGTGISSYSRDRKLEYVYKLREIEHYELDSFINEFTDFFKHSLPEMKEYDSLPVTHHASLYIRLDYNNVRYEYSSVGIGAKDNIDLDKLSELISYALNLNDRERTRRLSDYYFFQKIE